MATHSHITRRSAFTGAAAAILGGTVSGTALAALADSDAALQALGHRWEALRLACDAADDEAHRAYKRCQQHEPAMPEVLLWHPSDPEPLSPPRWRDPAGRRAWHFKDEIDLLRGYRASGYLNQHARDRALRRALEIVEASDAWDAAKKQVEHDSGYTAAEERADALQAEAHRVALQIAELPARTIDGIAVKARLLAHEGEGSTIDGDGEGLSGMLLKQILAFLTAAGRA